MSAVDDLAAEIRKHVAAADVYDGQPEGWWWYDGGSDGDLPEALAADLIKAGWQPPYICQHEWGSQIDGWYVCVLCGSEVRKPRVHQWSNPLSAEDFALLSQMGIATWLAKPRPTDD